MSHTERTPDARPYDTWRICGEPVDASKPHAGCDCTGNSIRPRRRILTDDQAKEEAA